MIKTLQSYSSGRLPSSPVNILLIGANFANMSKNSLELLILKAFAGYNLIVDFLIHQLHPYASFHSFFLCLVDIIILCCVLSDIVHFDKTNKTANINQVKNIETQMTRKNKTKH